MRPGEAYGLLHFNHNPYTMKTLVLFLLLYIGFANAQNITLDDINSKNIQELLKGKNTTYNSTIESTQIGNANKIEVYNKSGKSNIELSQIGNYNTTFFVNPDVKAKPQTKVNVNGFNNYIDITGSNSISEKLIINLKSDNKTVFMRNY